jgi:hypothetical protein
MPFLKQSTSAVVESKVNEMEATRFTFQLARFWLNANSVKNICERHRRMAPERAGQAHDAAK